MDEKLKELLCEYKEYIQKLLDHEHVIRKQACKDECVLHLQSVGIRLELDTGFCWNLYVQKFNNSDNYILNTSRRRLRTLMQQWPEGSGDCSYPVQGFDGNNAEDAYDSCLGNPKLIWGEGQYADARWNLLRYLAGAL